MGTLTKPVKTATSPGDYSTLLEDYQDRNAVAVVILNKTFKSYKPAMAILQDFQGIDGSGDPDAKEVWDTLEQEFVDGGESASLDPTELYKEYNNITQKYDESPLMYYARKNRYRRLLDRNGREILDEFFIRDLIAGLTREG